MMIMRVGPAWRLKHRVWYKGSDEMNKKNLMNWLRAGLTLQQICEIDGCTEKAEYSITRWHGLHIVVCREHFPRIGELDAMDEEELK